jgi:4-hydroxy-tetrahydrodipicolinate reductase
MADEVGIAVVGASGRMGRMLVRAVGETPGARLSGVTERPGHPWIGRDLGEAMGGPALGVVVDDDPLEVFARSQAVLDFTAPAATVMHSELAAQARLVHVIGTTGLEREHLERLAAAARHAVLVRAGNMSVGVNLLTVLVRRVAEVLGPDYDIEIVEMHHRAKVDAPSGTALMLGEAAAAGRRVNLADVAERGRDGVTGARAEGAIGFASLRGGDVVGEHEVVFAGPGERVVLKHVASDRMLFARGAIRAALWGQTQGPGQYNMIDVLGLRDHSAEIPDR